MEDKKTTQITLDIDEILIQKSHPVAVNGFIKPTTGYWVLENGGVYTTKLATYEKPLWIHRFFMRTLLGIRWEDSKIGKEL